jgi:hypothetical protein
LRLVQLPFSVANIPHASCTIIMRRSLYGALTGSRAGGGDRRYVSSNGHLTFGSGSTSWTATTANFFGRPMLAPYYVDLNPGRGGAVFKEMLADRAVITFAAVPYYSAVYSVTFQVELVFATSTISYTYGALTISTSGNVVRDAPSRPPSLLDAPRKQCRLLPAPTSTSVQRLPSVCFPERSSPCAPGVPAADRPV